MTELILASASTARAAMLRDAGVPCSIQPANVDEAAIKNQLQKQDTPPDQIASALAEAKAAAVSKSNPAAMVIGADQVLVHRGTLFDKPSSIAEAREHLETLRGDQHRLISAVAVVQNGTQLWATATHTDLEMREFSDAFLDSYLTAMGQKVLTSVGAYHLEGLGAQLFNCINGDFFTVLGLPLLELLEFLRTRGTLTT